MSKTDGTYKATVRAVVEIKVDGTWSAQTSIHQVRMQALKDAEDRVHRAMQKMKWCGSKGVQLTLLDEDGG